MPVSQLELEEESLLGEHSEGGYKRRSQPPAPRWRNMLTFVLTAMVSGLIFYLIIFSFILSRPGLREKSKEYLFGTSKGNDAPANATEALTNGPVDAEFWDHYIPKPGPDHKSEDGLFDMSADELRAMLASTNGYFARDWSVWLGWNNMRYILEGALMQAQLLNRTLIIPSFVYARACEFHNDVCAKYAKMVNKNDAFYSTEWSSWPIEKQMSFVIPMEMMIDVPHLRKTHKFMMLSEYFHLQGLNATHETTNGQWDRDYYVSGSPKPSMFIIPNHIYDPENIGRVDTFDFPNAPTGQNLTGVAVEYDRRLSEKAQGKKTGIISWKDARDAVSSVGVLQDDAGLEAALRSANWLTMHTFEGDMGMDFTKTVIKPIRQVMRMSDARAWVEDYKHVTQDIVWLQGEVHLGRKAGLMRFTTEEARDTFARIVLHDVLPPKRVRDLAATVDKRLNNINKGRAWMASHMRRGDFVTAGWTMESTIEKHYERIQRRLALGRKILEELTPAKWETYNIPDVSVNQELSHRPPPKDGDFIYLATDERSPDGLKYLQEHGALLFDNVVTAQDRRDFGWGLLFTDIIALVEQQIIGHGSSFFYAHAMSSVAGGMVNIRAANGADRRSNLID